jgi:hypothetical protein
VSSREQHTSRCGKIGTGGDSLGAGDTRGGRKEKEKNEIEWEGFLGEQAMNLVEI